MENNKDCPCTMDCELKADCRRCKEAHIENNSLPLCESKK